MKRYLFLLVSLVLGLALFAACVAVPVAEQPASRGPGTAYFETLNVADLTVTDTFSQGGAAVISDNVTITGTLGVTGTTTLAGAAVLNSTLGVTGATTLGAALNKLTAGAGITVTNGTAFTVTATMQPLRAAGTVTPTLTIPAAGVYACLYNTSAQTINLADSSNQVLASAIALGQYDMLCGYSDGTRFIEIDRSNN